MSRAVSDVSETAGSESNIVPCQCRADLFQPPASDTYTVQMALEGHLEPVEAVNVIVSTTIEDVFRQIYLLCLTSK